jgi:hypothetical protein
MTSERAEATAGAEVQLREAPAAFTFGLHRPHPLFQGSFCQDMAVFRPEMGQLELVRLSIRPASSQGHGNVKVAPVQRTPSALTEMMRARTRLGEQSDLSVEGVVRARWGIPFGAGEGEDAGLLAGSLLRRDVSPKRHAAR